MAVRVLEERVERRSKGRAGRLWKLVAALMAGGMASSNGVIVGEEGRGEFKGPLASQEVGVVWP